MSDFNKDWINFINECDDPYRFVKEYKLRTSPKEMCAGKKTSMYTAFLEEAYSYTYD